MNPKKYLILNFNIICINISEYFDRSICKCYRTQACILYFKVLSEQDKMLGGLFIYNHKGEVLISRVYRDDIGYL